MNKGQRLYKFILGLLMPFLFLACSSKERIKIDLWRDALRPYSSRILARPFEKGTCHGIEYNISLCVLELSRTTAR